MIVKQVVGEVYSSNTFIVINNKQAVIIDAGATLDMVLPHTKDVSVEAIFLTHLHFDHVYHLSSYVKKFKCKVYLFNEEHVDSRKYLLALLMDKIEMPKNCYISILKDDNIIVNGFNVQAIHTPGHSNDSMCYKIEHLLFSGDTLFSDSIGRTDLPTSNLVDMKSSLHKLTKVDFKTCHSGHGESTNYTTQQQNIKYFLSII